MTAHAAALRRFIAAAQNHMAGELEADRALARAALDTAWAIAADAEAVSAELARELARAELAWADQWLRRALGDDEWLVVESPRAALANLAHEILRRCV